MLVLSLHSADDTDVEEEEMMEEAAGVGEATGEGGGDGGDAPASGSSAE